MVQNRVADEQHARAFGIGEPGFIEPPAFAVGVETRIGFGGRLGSIGGERGQRSERRDREEGAGFASSAACNAASGTSKRAVRSVLTNRISSVVGIVAKRLHEDRLTAPI